MVVTFPFPLDIALALGGGSSTLMSVPLVKTTLNRTNMWITDVPGTVFLLFAGLPRHYVVCLVASPPQAGSDEKQVYVSNQMGGGRSYLPDR
jgi:hypothetical protein